MRKNHKKGINIRKFKRFFNVEITCAGMPKNCYSQVEWNSFKTGFVAHGKLTFDHIKGGVKLIETDFTIKEDELTRTIEKF